MKVFASQAQTVAGHSEFLGTGGSLYYLRHTDLLPGSDQLVLEVRDPSTGSVVNRISLVRGIGLRHQRDARADHDDEAACPDCHQNTSTLFRDRRPVATKTTCWRTTNTCQADSTATT